MSTGARLGILAGVIVVAIVALVIASGGSDDNSSAGTTSAATSTSTGTDTTSTGGATTTTAKPAGPPTYRVTVRDAKPVGGVEKIKVKKGDQVRLVVQSDTADEIHIHGYDFMNDVEAGGTVRFRFKAD